MSSDHLNGGTADYRDFLYAAHVGTTSANQRVVGKMGLEIGFGVMDEDSDRLSSLDKQQADPFVTKCLFSFIRRSCQAEAQVWAGYEYNMGNTNRLSDAFTVRAAWQIPNRSFQLGPYYEYDRVGNGVDRRYRGGFGIRADLGFSLLSFYIASGLEPRLYEPIRTARGFAISAGVSISANGRRLWNFLSGRSGY
jgi:hypothetical protein